MRDVVKECKSLCVTGIGIEMCRAEVRLLIEE